MAKTEKSQEAPDTMEVFVTFKEKAFPGLVIVWKVGTNKLELCRMGGTRGNTHLETKTHSKYKTAEGAHAGAVRWFGLLANIYNVSTVEAKQEA